MDFDKAMPSLCFMAGMWAMALLISAVQGRADSFALLLVSPFISGLILFLINHFGLKLLGRK